MGGTVAEPMSRVGGWIQNRFYNPLWLFRIQLGFRIQVGAECGKKNLLIEYLEVGEIIPFPVWTIPFPVLKINFEFFGTYKKHFGKEFFYQRPRSGRNNFISCLHNSISCLNNSISCLENQF